MYQSRVAGFEWVGSMGQIMGGHPLQHRGGRVLGSEASGDFDQASGWHDSIIGVGSRCTAIGHTIPHLDFGDVRSDCLHHASALLTQREGQRIFIQAAANVDIDEVDANGIDLYKASPALGVGVATSS